MHFASDLLPLCLHLQSPEARAESPMKLSSCFFGLAVGSSWSCLCRQVSCKQQKPHRSSSVMWATGASDVSAFCMALMSVASCREHCARLLLMLELDTFSGRSVPLLHPPTLP